MRCQEVDLLRQRFENTLNSTESVTEGLASRLKETDQGEDDADRADTVAKNAHSEARLEDQSAQQLLRERDTERAQEALFEIRYQESESSRQQLEPSSSHSAKWEQRRKLLKAAHITWRLKEGEERGSIGA